VTKAIESRAVEFMILIYKHAIALFYNANKTSLNTIKPHIDDLTALMMMHILVNPYLLLVFDDCASQLQQFARAQFMKELYFQARHMFLMSIMILQSATSLDKQLRSNMHIVFFTSGDVMSSYFDLGGSKRDKAIAQHIASSNFFDHSTGVYRVLTYNRLLNGGTFGFVLSEASEGKRFGSAEYWSYAEALNKGNKLHLRKMLGLM